MPGDTKFGPSEVGWRWEVALSFASAQRPYVERVAAALTAHSVRCFFDADGQIDLWGRSLAEELPSIYADQAAAVVVFVSHDYATQDWTRLERRAAIVRAARERREYVLPARFDDTPLPGLLSDLVAVDLRIRDPEDFAGQIVAKLQQLGVLGVDCAPSELANDIGAPAKAGRATVPGAQIGPATREIYRYGLQAAAAAASCELALTRWTAIELSELRDRLEAWRFRTQAADAAVGRAIDVLQALGDSLALRPVLAALGAANVKIDYLKHIYWRTVGRIPSGNTLESLIVEAASAGVVEERTGADVPLTALARYVVGIAGHCDTEPDHPALLSWLDARHHQVADAHAYLAAVRRPAWLLVDLGDEPRRPADGRHPRYPRPGAQQVRVSGVLHTAGGNRFLEHESSEGLEAALRGLLRQVGAERRLVVDLAAPHALIAAGLEHLPVVDTGDGYAPLSTTCHPRLRWSLRLHHATRLNQAPHCAPVARWNKVPTVMGDEVLADRRALNSWLDDSRNQDLPYVVGGAPADAGFDPLVDVLRSGRSFIIWFAQGVDSAAARKISKVARRLHPASRRIGLPEQVDYTDRKKMIIIWDDPEGREGFAMPNRIPGFGT